MIGEGEVGKRVRGVGRGIGGDEQGKRWWVKRVYWEDATGWHSC